MCICIILYWNLAVMIMELAFEHVYACRNLFKTTSTSLVQGVRAFVTLEQLLGVSLSYWIPFSCNFS